MLRELTGGVKPARDPAGPRPKGRNPLPEPRQVSKAKAAAAGAAAEAAEAAAAAEASAGRGAQQAAAKKQRWHKVQHKKRKGNGFGDAWDAAQLREQADRDRARAEQDEGRQEARAWLAGASLPPPPKRRRGPAPHTPSAVRPVMVDAPGCSVNPDEPARQDAVAAVVAAERRKEIAKMLERKAPPAALLLLPPSAAGGGVGGGFGGGGEGGEGEVGGWGSASGVREDELARLLSGGGGGRSDSGSEEEEEEEAGGAGGPATPDAGGGGGAAARDGQQRQRRSKTQKDRNREARRRLVDADLAARRDLKAQRRALDALPAIRAEIEDGEREKARLSGRRAADRAEKRATLPPRLGKRRFVPEPPMAPDAEEAAAGSLRCVTPCALVALDRLRSLQHRGLIEPRRPAPGSAVGVRRRGRRDAYVVGGRLEKAAAAQDAVHALRDARVRLQRKAQRRGLMVPGVAVGPASAGGGLMMLGGSALGGGGGGGPAAGEGATGAGAAPAVVGW